MPVAQFSEPFTSWALPVCVGATAATVGNLVIACASAKDSVCAEPVLSLTPPWLVAPGSTMIMLLPSEEILLSTVACVP